MKAFLLDRFLPRVLPVFLSIFLAAATFACAYSIVHSAMIFSRSQKQITEVYDNALEAIAVAAAQSEEDDPQKDNMQDIQTMIKYLTELQALQKSSSSSDVMTFLFSTLSSVLVGVCAAFAAKSFSNVEKAKCSAEAAEKAAKSAADAKARYDGAERRLKGHMKKFTSLEASVAIHQIMIDIIDARNYLSVGNVPMANESIVSVRDAVKKLNPTWGYEVVAKLEDTILGLHHYKITTEMKKYINEAIRICDEFMTEIETENESEDEDE